MSIIKLKDLIIETIQFVKRDGMFRTDPNTPDEIINIVHDIVQLAKSENRNITYISIASPDLEADSNPDPYEEDLWVISIGNICSLSFSPSTNLWVYDDTINPELLDNQVKIENAKKKLVKKIPKL
jgi:hypothetical protein